MLIQSREAWRAVRAVDQIAPTAVCQLFRDFGGLTFGHHRAVRRNHAPICAQHGDIAINDLAEHLAFDLRPDVQEPLKGFARTVQPRQGRLVGWKEDLAIGMEHRDDPIQITLLQIGADALRDFAGLVGDMLCHVIAFGLGLIRSRRSQLHVDHHEAMFLECAAKSPDR